MQVLCILLHVGHCETKKTKQKGNLFFLGAFLFKKKTLNVPFINSHAFLQCTSGVQK